MKNNDGTDERPVVDLLEFVRPVFEKGEGIVLLQADMPDAAILLAIKHAAAFRKPFTVVPASTSAAELHVPQVPDRMTQLKSAELRKQGYLTVGYVMQKDTEHTAVSAQGAVRWLDSAEYWALMHPPGL
jgi:hypothetical protein